MKDKKMRHTQITDVTADVEFCLNCNDMDDLAISEEAAGLNQVQNRFNNCRETGRFQGDLCARLFVAEDRIDNSTFFADEDEVS